MSNLYYNVLQCVGENNLSKKRVFAMTLCNEIEMVNC